MPIAVKMRCHDYSNLPIWRIYKIEIVKFHLSMDCFWAEIVSGDLVLKEHEAAKWLSREELDSVDWLPADLELIEKIKEQM